MEMGVSGNSGEDDSLLTNEAALQRILAFESMIDITATQLIDIRGLGLNEFTLQEIRTLEGKLIRQFCQQLQTKFLVARNTSDNSFPDHPSLLKWLNVVGVSSVLAKALKMRCYSVEDLLALSDHQLQNIIGEMDGDAEDERKMISSLKQLRNYQNMLRQRKVQHIDTSDMYWDSWSKADDIFNSANSQSHDFNENVKGDKEYLENGMHDQSAGTSRHGSESSDSNAFESQQKVHRTRSNTDPSNAELPPAFHELPSRQRSHQLPSTSSSCLTPPSPSCHGSKSSLESDSGMGSVARNTAPNASPPPLKSKIFVIPPSPMPMYTPPVTPGTPHKNSHFQVQTGSRSLTRERVSSTGTGSSSARSTKLTTGNLLPPFHSLKPSKSSEWHIGTRINKSVAHGDSISASNQSLASIASSTGHKHGKIRKEKKRPGNLVLTNESTIPNYIDMQRTANPRKNSITISPENNISNSASPLSPRTPMTPMTPYNPELRAIEQKINSLRTPSSPQTPKSSKMGTKIRDFFGMKKRKNKHKRQKSTEQLDKDDPPVSHFWPPTTPPHHNAHSRPISSRQSNGSEENGMFGASYDYHPQHSSSNLDISSLASTLSSSLVDTDRTILADRREEDADGAGSRVHTITQDHPEVESDDGSTLVEREAEDVVSKPDIEDIKKNLFRQSSTIQSMSEEWDIPFSELQFGDSIGSGRVGTVYRGRWHGEVAIRVIDINHNDEEKLRAFKQEIMTYKKTRHENLELYMGSCMHPPHLTIVTGLCKGQSLYHHIRGRSVNINQAKIYGQHIVQGMGYLHSKGIIHKDLKSKNIFVNGKHVVITDFGVVGLHAVAGDKHSRPGSLSIPDGWLCHLAPEVIKALRIPQYEGDEVISTLPYTIQSDVFAFGTVWYELMSGSWPFNGLPAESIIWQVGSGKKQNLSQLQGGKDIKDILMQAWSFDPSRRPDFSDNGIMGILKRLQNHIHRSYSSHPRRGGQVNRGASHERLYETKPLRPPQFTPLHEMVE